MIVNSRRHTSGINPIIFELIQHALAAVAEQMAVTVVRTARSTVSKEVMDFSTAICNAKGELVAQGMCLPIMLGCIPAAMKAVLERFKTSEIDPGDVFILNDPYEGGSHLPERFMFRPVFSETELLGFACVVTHHADIGGIAAGGISAASTEIFQEGLRIPGSKLHDRGKINDTLMSLIARNVRVPEKVLGDLQSQISACKHGEEGLMKIVAEYGTEATQRNLDALLEHSELRTRDALRKLPDGRFSFEDFLDDDGKSADPIRICVTVIKQDDELVVDFTGTDRQVNGAINMTASDTLSCVCFAVRCILDSDIPNNEGCFRPLKIVTTPGSIVDALPPAAVASRVLTSFRVADTIFGALAALAPDKVPACGMAVDCNVAVSGTNPDGTPFVQIDWLAGSWGGRPNRDGIDHVSALASNISNTPIELVEAESPLLVEEYTLVPDTAGAGQYRGGLAVRRSWRLHGVDEAYLQVRSDRLKFAPYGLQGGAEGAKGRNTLTTSTGNEVMPSKFQRTIHRGDRITLQTAAAGGWGPPQKRDDRAVEVDVRQGKISLARAKEIYGHSSRSADESKHASDHGRGDAEAFASTVEPR
jgi:N-methylhydantoinase B